MLLVALVAARSMTPLAKLADAAETRWAATCAARRSACAARRKCSAWPGIQRRTIAHLLEHLDTHQKLLAAMSHDLKTPITRLKLRAEMLDDDAIARKICPRPGRNAGAGARNPGLSAR